MASAPLLEHLDLNVTTPIPRNFSKPFSSPVLPSTEVYGFRDPPPRFPWTTITHRESPPLRRKPSCLDLGGSIAAGRTPRHTGQVTCTPAALARFQPEDSRTAISSPQQFPTPTSPSLASTITTLESTPTHSPITAGDATFERLLLAGSVTSKRKFPLLRQPKRLPRRAASAWCIYAAVVEREIGADNDIVVSSDTNDLLHEGSAERVAQEVGERGRSVRFAGTAKDSSRAAKQASSGDDKETTAGSTYTLSKFTFPEPPGHTWVGTFGHLGEPTPPTSPTTLHYRGALFDLVNPHASLVLGKHEIETPAEIDGLLDDYFAERTDMQYDDITGELIAGSPAIRSQNGSKPGQRYDSVEQARAAITGPQEYPGGSIQIPGETLQRFLAGLPHEGPTQQIRTEDSAISMQRDSMLSDPFDLDISENEKKPKYPTGYEVFEAEASADADRRRRREQGDLPESDDGADDTATAYHTGRDTTIGGILNAYDYLGNPLSEPKKIPSSLPPSSSSSDAEALEKQTEQAIAWTTDRMTRGGTRKYHRTTMAAHPMAMWAHQPGPKAEDNVEWSPPRRGPGMRRAPVQPEVTELPTSEQTYGATGELLQLTPENNQHPKDERSYPYPTGGTEHIGPVHYDEEGYGHGYSSSAHQREQNVLSPEYYGGPFAEVYQEGDKPLQYPDALYQERFYQHDDKENIAPDDDYSTVGVVNFEGGEVVHRYDHTAATAQYNAEQSRAEQYQIEQYQAEQYRAEQYQAAQYQAEQYHAGEYYAEQDQRAEQYYAEEYYAELRESGQYDVSAAPGDSQYDSAAIVEPQHYGSTAAAYPQYHGPTDSEEAYNIHSAAGYHQHHEPAASEEPYGMSGTPGPEWYNGSPLSMYYHDSATDLRAQHGSTAAEDSQHQPPAASEEHPGIPSAWSNVDLPPRHRASLRVQDRHVFGEPLPRTSSHYSVSEEADWEDTQASESRANVFVKGELPADRHRESQVSYAKTSDAGTMCEPPQPTKARPSLRAMHGHDGAADKPYLDDEGDQLLRTPPPIPPTPVGNMHVMRARRLIETILQEKGKMHTYDGRRKTFMQQWVQDQEAELEQLRVSHRLDLKEAVCIVADAASARAKQPVQEGGSYDPETAFQEIIRKLSMADLSIKADTHSVSSERAVFEPPSPPFSGNDLEYSPTCDTFRTMRDKEVYDRDGRLRVPFVDGLPPVGPLPPLQKPGAVMTLDGYGVASSSKHRAKDAEEYEMDNLRPQRPVRPKGEGRAMPKAAMSGQTALIPIQLTTNTNTQESSITSVFNSNGRRLTNAELIAREPHWTMDPVKPRRLGLDLAITTVAADDDTEPMLLNRLEACNYAELREQAAISQRYFCACALTPISAVLFGLGYFDGKARSVSQGRVREMRPRDKMWALWVAMPLGIGFYLAVALMVVVFVVVIPAATAS